MIEPHEYLGTVSPVTAHVQISGVPDTLVYAAGDVLFRNSDSQAFLLPCMTMGRNRLADMDFLVVREKATGAGVVVKANIDFKFTRIGKTDWVPPAMNAPFSGPTDMEDALGTLSVVTANYEEWKVGGVIAYAIACVPITEAIRRMLISDVDVTDFYVTPTIGTGTPMFGASSLVTAQFIMKPY